MSWVNSLDSKTARATVASVSLAAAIPLLVYLDSQYASAADMAALEGVVHTFIVDSYELSVGVLDDKIAEAESQLDMNPRQRELLAKRRARREAYIRKLERLRE